METEPRPGAPPPLSPAVKRSLADDVVDRLRDAIFHGSYKPGEPLREEQLAAMLDVSRGPVREALVQLEREGLVIVRRHRGATVARLSRADLEEVYSLRLALERLAMQRAVHNATDRDFAALEAVLADFDSALARGPSEKEIAELDVRFHDLIYQAARHQRLYDSWANLKSQIYIFLLSRNVANPDFREVTVKSHADLLESLRARDETRAITEIEAHLRGAYDRVVLSYSPAEDGSA
ncbi:MAG TPA: GntR family transcriptional regulator [Roseiflexaceae bacterium]|nr:GntR family transcriptional regulator [Roseiflexaceae bacterium]